MGRDHSIVVKNVQFYVLAFFKHNILATVGVSDVIVVENAHQLQTKNKKYSFSLDWLCYFAP